jgi:outer membrane protein OmpA-like peptidoglycan-associated protein
LKISSITLAAVIALGASTQAHAQNQNPVNAGHETPSYQINVVSRTTPAVTYKHRSGSTKIDFAGTTLMPSAEGVAKVESKRGTMAIEVEFSGLDRPTSFGNEYLTYVLWAISPEGRPVNIGEVLVGNDRRSKLDVTTDLQAFAMIVTAEPYYAVRRPSDVVILENVVRPDTRGSTEEVDAKYELIGRGGYIPTGFKFDVVLLDAKLPLEFFEARNAVRIAKSAGAEEYAATSYAKAVSQMDEADRLTRKHENKKSLVAVSRGVVQTAEDAREISMKHIDDERLAAERRAGAGREASANARANDESQRRADAEIASAEALRQKNEADRRNQDAQAAAQQSAAGQANAEAASAEAMRLKNEADRKNQDAQAAAQQSAANQADAEKARNDAQIQAQAAQAESDRNAAAAAASAAAAQTSAAAAASSDAQLQQAVHDREELRARLLQQFNLIMETHDTARGLVVNMSDVLFDTGKYTLRPAAREKLAKISGIVLAYPTLMLAIEGNTDNVGTEDFNQTLSEKRAEAVRSYLTHEGIPEASTTATGFGKTRPIATNDTSDGRQLNRRVELVVSGEVIGTKIVSMTISPVVPQVQPR